MNLIFKLWLFWLFVINPLMTATRNNKAIKLKLCILFKNALRESQLFFHQSILIRYGDTASGHL